MVKIYCDEAGNSGANLFDREQPCFVLSSNDFSHEEASELLDHVRSLQGGEPKFTSLKKSAGGRAKLIRFLADPRLGPERVLVNVFHKRFLVVTKIVDLIAETVIHLMGGDLYERGANLAMSNMLFYCMPVLCGEENTESFLRSFVELVRRRGAEQVEAFYAAGGRMLLAAPGDFKQDLVLFTERRLFDIWWDDSVNSLALDPAIPALFDQIATWGARKEERFDVIHDASKPILASQDTFESMMALCGEESNLIGYDRRKVKFPLRANSLSQADSTDHPQLQVADLCAGLINHYMKCRMAGEIDELASATGKFGRLDWVSDGVVPTPEVDPEALGTAETGGTNPMDGITDYLQRRRGGRAT